MAKQRIVQVDGKKFKLCRKCGLPALKDTGFDSVGRMSYQCQKCGWKSARSNQLDANWVPAEMQWIEGAGWQVKDGRFK